MNVSIDYFVNPKFLDLYSLSKNFSGNDSFSAFEGQETKFKKSFKCLAGT